MSGGLMMDEHQIKLFQSKAKDDWGTPQKIISDLTREFGEMYDPCPFYPDEDGLIIDWKKVMFVNPPYSQVKLWLEKAHYELKVNHCEVIIFLLFANTDTRWFHDYIYGKAELRFLKGRLKFIDRETMEVKNSAMRPSMLCIFKNE